MKQYLESLAISALAVLAPIKATLLTVGTLVLADLVVGIMAARKRGEPITSAGFRRTVSKTLTYQAAVILGFLVETYLTDGALPITKITAGLIGITELKSVLENVDFINGNKLFGTLITKLGSQNDPRSQDKK